MTIFRTSFIPPGARVRILFDSKHAARIALGNTHAKRNIALSNTSRILQLQAKNRVFSSAQQGYSHACAYAFACDYALAVVSLRGTLRVVADAFLWSRSGHWEGLNYRMCRWYNVGTCLSNILQNWLANTVPEFSPIQIVFFFFFFFKNCGHDDKARRSPTRVDCDQD